MNNAGGGTYNDIESVTLDEWPRIMSINLDSTFIGTQAAIRWMKRTGGGKIINVSSVAAFSGAPNLAAYCAAKAGINMMSKSAAVYCGQKGYNIRINVVPPGLIETKSGVEMARLAIGAQRGCHRDVHRPAPDRPHRPARRHHQRHPVSRVGRIQFRDCREPDHRWRFHCRIKLSETISRQGWDRARPGCRRCPDALAPKI
ncbi:SDR family NAD(P)-dependent oxidoreductase [Aromatoleum petrolei]|uniref:SDR family NAD(P)-dependent oxidoreductase n=1 Tax=Aromatoleum petrolei TaxID=76116 RepID=UPI00145D248B|nr:SDR family NAD(P)-dependent oxidoreductase [Aromatoleum petrolei]